VGRTTPTLCRSGWCETRRSTRTWRPGGTIPAVARRRACAYSVDDEQRETDSDVREPDHRSPGACHQHHGTHECLHGATSCFPSSLARSRCSDQVCGHEGSGHRPSASAADLGAPARPEMVTRRPTPSPACTWGSRVHCDDRGSLARCRKGDVVRGHTRIATRVRRGPAPRETSNMDISASAPTIGRYPTASHPTLLTRWRT
jgi:hypothetical protein